MGKRAAEATAALVPCKTKPGKSKNGKGKRKGDDGSSGVLAESAT